MIDYTAGPAETYWYILNAHGNVIALADKNSDRIVNYQYDAWGNLVNRPEGILTGNDELLHEANPFRYSSYQLDPETGLYYLKARYYNPDLGRFLTRDPMLAVNSYSYALNNPVNFYDPTGIVPIPIITGLIGLGVSVAVTATTQLITTGTIDLGDLLAAGVSGFVQGALMPIIGTTYAETMIAGAVGGAVSQGIHNITHGKQIEKNIATSASIGALSGLITGPYKHSPSRLSPAPRTIGRGETNPLEGFYAAAQKERVNKAAIVNSISPRSVASTLYATVVGRAATAAESEVNVSSPSRPLKLILQKYGEY